ncbi:HU family DNA-binding protein [Methyloligella sp. GL2]|uniref:HU family DNA-binding protein n=1 Tax=Methyloligella sp. 2.7D TaxID=3085160 RepID=UPI00157C5926|nr:HU family DNA-binding protein [Methyloligella sp. GL2]
MNKADLVAQVAQEAALSLDEAEIVVDATFKAIENALKNGDTVRIIGFGNFQVADRKASTGRNPRTGETVQIPASRVPKFRAGKSLKESVNPRAAGGPRGRGGGPTRKYPLQPSSRPADDTQNDQNDTSETDDSGSSGEAA